MTQKRYRIAIVVQRYGEEVNGGAELHARWLAEHLLPLADVHVVTTCAVEYSTWVNEYPSGETTLNGVIVHRFPVDAPRNWVREMRQTQQLLLHPHTLIDEYTWLKEQGPFSTPLFDYLQTHHRIFDVFIFFTYLYAQTFFGLPLVSDKAILVPTAHEEPFLKLPLFRSLFHLPRAIAYNTETERQTVRQHTHNHRVPSEVVGVALNVPEQTSGGRFRQKYGVQGEFMLYVGRIDEAKNVPELLAYFEKFQDEEKRPFSLILIGKNLIPLPDRPDIRHLGFVSEQDKFDAITAATLGVMPSIYESLSMITLETWFMGKPMLVNGRCEVLRQLCRQSNGGLYYNSYEEFKLTLNWLLNSAESRTQLGQQGQTFVQHTYTWDIVIAKYRQLFEQITK